MGFPLLNSTSWAQEPLKRLFEEVVSILEGVYGHNLDDFRPRVVGFDYVGLFSPPTPPTQFPLWHTALWLMRG